MYISGEKGKESEVFALNRLLEESKLFLLELTDSEQMLC